MVTKKNCLGKNLEHAEVKGGLSKVLNAELHLIGACTAGT